ncbi:MAG: FAD-dependent oxidoreductase, partial [Acidimicrobiia bacterium]|nr:FAD-dependent oxidoreductase [Acidimicrobiia bacterium]
LGHVRGASHDHSRIIRRSYHTSAYVRLAASAYDAWREVEADADLTLITRTGGVDLFPANAAIDPRPYRNSLDANGVEYEWLDGDEVRRRWPAFTQGTLVDDAAFAIHSAATGIVPANRGAATLRRLAVEHGAELRANSPVLRVHPGQGEVEVVTVDGGGRPISVTCGSVVVCTDAWTNRLLEPLGHRVAMAVTREQVSYFPVRPAQRLDDLAVGRFPVWIWMDDPSYYGFPMHGPAEVADRIKGSEDCGGPEIDPDTRGFDPDAGMEQRLGRFMADLLGDRFGRPKTTTCLYALTADRDFVVDRLPDHPEVVVGLGAAHGFKFAAWFGRVLADLALSGRRSADLVPFAIDRSGLRRPIDRQAWLV